MKYLIKLFMVVFVFTLASSVFAQEEGQEMSPEMKAWVEYKTPGLAHEMMAKSVGEWTAELAGKNWLHRAVGCKTDNTFP